MPKIIQLWRYGFLSGSTYDVWARRAASAITWSRCHLVCHWLLSLQQTHKSDYVDISDHQGREKSNSRSRPTLYVPLKIGPTVVAIATTLHQQSLAALDSAGRDRAAWVPKFATDTIESLRYRDQGSHALRGTPQHWVSERESHFLS